MYQNCKISDLIVSYAGSLKLIEKEKEVLKEVSREICGKRIREGEGLIFFRVSLHVKKISNKANDLGRFS